MRKNALQQTSLKDVFYFINKRFIPAFVALALCFTLLPSGSRAENDFQFTFPTNGSDLVMGNSYTITWTKNPGANIQFVHLSLIDTNEIVAGTIASLTVDGSASSGSYIWAIPLESSPQMVLHPGEHYRIKAVASGPSNSATFLSGLITISANVLAAPDLQITTLRIGSWAPNGFHEVQLRQDWVSAMEFTVKNIGATTARGNIQTMASIGGVYPNSLCSGVIGNLILAPNESETYLCQFLNQVPLGPVNASVSITGVPQETVFSNNTLVRQFTILAPSEASNVTVSNTGAVASNIIIAPEQTSALLAQFKAKASIGENIKANKIVFYSDEKPIKFLKNIKLYSGNHVWSAALQPQTWYGTNIVFDNLNLTISAGQEATFSLKADLTADALPTFQSSINFEGYGTSKFLSLSSGQEVEILGENIKTNFTVLSIAPETPLVLSYSASNVRSNSATIIWRTSRPASSLLTITTTDPDIIKSSASYTTEHSFSVSGLKPGTDYNYIISGKSSADLDVPAAYGTFKTAKDGTGAPKNEAEHVTKEKKEVRKIDKSLTDRSAGKFYLQVESKGEAWYVAPRDGKKYYLADGASAYEALRKFGVGAKNEDLRKIPIGEPSYKLLDTDRDGLDDKTEQSVGSNPSQSDTDGDGYKDGTEVYAGYNPVGSGKMPIDRNFANKMKGKIFIQVEGKGEAWYINPADGKRYFLADADTAYEMMRRMSTGITNDNLRKIAVGDL